MILGNKNKTISALRQKVEACEAEIRLLKNSSKPEGIVETANFSLPVLSRVLDLAGIGYWIRSSEKETLWLSPSARDIMGIPVELISWDSFRNIILPEDRAVFDKSVADNLQSGKKSELELKIARSEGDAREFRLINMEIATLPFKEGTAEVRQVMGTVRDISRQDKLKRDLIRGREKAEDAGKLRNALLANISHEIRTPMNSIIGFSELLNIGNLPYDKRHEYVKTIKNQGIFILKMIDDLIELTRIETGRITIRKSPCNVDLMLQELVIIFSQYKKIQNKDFLDIRISLPQSPGIVIFTDSGRLQQLMTNLIHNSIKFTEKGWIEIGYKPTADQKIEFYVKDTGIGLSKELQKNIFSPFAEEETVNAKQERAGLGLTISKNLIKLLGGKIWVESELGQGSTFYFTIPLEEVPESYHVLAPDEETEIPSFTWKDKVILVAEDDEVNFRFMEVLLQDTGVQILHASNGVQAVELCKSITKIDLVLMDLKMPEMNGIDATRQIRLFNRKLPIIAQTAFVLDSELQKCLDAGCDDHITKPIDIKEFLEKVDKYLRER
jgi:signal transduction histidine kinase/CheY-like chemotaxis protein